MSDTQTIRGKLEKSFKNEHGFYSVKVGGKWHNTGKKDYASLEDSIVEFTVAKNKRGYFDLSGEIEAVAASPAERSSGGGGGGGKGNSTQVSIERQMSYKAGVDIVLALVAQDKLSVGAKGKAYDNTLGLIDRAAEHVYNGVSGAGFNKEEEEEAADPAAPPSADWNPTEA